MSLTAQEIFDKVATGALAQNKQSLGDDGQCRYRGNDGCKCFAGMLIDDDKYDPRFEGKGVGSPHEDDSCELKLLSNALVSSGVAVEHFPLVGWLQSIHDANAPEYWRHELTEAALHWNLSPAVLDAAAGGGA